MSNLVPTAVVPTFSTKTYDFLKNSAQIYLPAVAVLYFSLAGVWGLPYGGEVAASITAVDLFLGTVLKLSNKKYLNNEENIDGTVDEAMLPPQLLGAKTVTFKVTEAPLSPPE